DPVRAAVDGQGLSDGDLGRRQRDRLPRETRVELDGIAGQRRRDGVAERARARVGGARDGLKTSSKGESRRQGEENEEAARGAHSFLRGIVRSRVFDATTRPRKEPGGRCELCSSRGALTRPTSVPARPRRGS